MKVVYMSPDFGTVLKNGSNRLAICRRLIATYDELERVVKDAVSIELTTREGKTKVACLMR